MDTITHTLFGLAQYGAMQKRGMAVKTQVALFGVSIGANLIPDIDVQWAGSGPQYLMLHRGITHSLFFVPIWVGMFTLLAALLLRVKDRKIPIAATAGVLIHILSDWTNAWGTGLLEPLTANRYALGIIPNKGNVFWGIAAVSIVLLLIMRRRWPSYRTVRVFWALSACYVGFQLIYSAYIWSDLKGQGYAQVALRADTYPGSVYYYAKQDEEIVAGRYTLQGNKEVIATYGADPAIEALLKQNEQVERLLLFAPFIAIERLDDGFRVFDPRFGGRVDILEVLVQQPHSSGY